MGRPRKAKGLGDVVGNITKATGIDKVAKAVLGDDCGCDERKEYLNKLFPFGKRVRQCLTKDQKEYLKEFFVKIPSVLHTVKQRELSEIYKHVFGIEIDTQCASCWREYIQDLKNIYENTI